MNNVIAYYVPSDSTQIYLYASDAVDIVLSAFLTWTEQLDSDRYDGIAVLCGSFTGKRNDTGGLDGVFVWRGRSYTVIDSTVTSPPE